MNQNDIWRALDAVLIRINGIDISDCTTPYSVKSRIYHAMMELRPSDIMNDIRNTADAMYRTVYVISRWRDGICEGPVIAYDTEERANGWLDEMSKMQFTDPGIEYTVTVVQVFK